MEQTLSLPEIQLAERIPLNEVMAVTGRLTDLLRQESDFLKQMNIREAAKLQDEKIKLTAWLEAQKKIVAIHPELRDLITNEERRAMEEVIGEFTEVVEDNFRQVGIARLVNQKVVQAITDALRENNQVATYNAHGVNAARAQGALSYNLNQKA